MGRAIVSSERKNGKLSFRPLSFKEEDAKNVRKSDYSEESLKHEKQKLKTFVPITSLAVHKETMDQVPRTSIPEPFVYSSPRPVTELDAAATKLQTVYKSYRTSRNLADCAVVVEELWWKALDSVALKQSSMSFFAANKHEPAVSRWSRARTRVAKVGKGSGIDCVHSTLSRPHHVGIYGKEREAYEVVVENGKLVYKQSWMFLNTTKGSKWIFVLSTSRILYVGKKKKGVFQHSSFLSGGATTAAGRLVARDGILEAIWPYSGHYLPTEDNFMEFINFIEEHHVDLANVKKCAIDDDKPFSEVLHEMSNKGMEKTLSQNHDADIAKGCHPVSDVSKITAHEENFTPASKYQTEAPFLVLAKQFARKWTSGVGPRIGCVRDYPMDLQSQALETVNLSPKVTLSHSKNCYPIPSPRLSPKIRVSPRLAYMGFPSPRVSVTTTD